MKILTFLHTSATHIATFNQLLTELAPDIPVTHLVDESLLADARISGLTTELTGRITHTLNAAVSAGAAVIVCTCSTIGECAEQAPHSGNVPVLRIDRPMAEQAVDMGNRIIIAAALASTLAPTRLLLLEAADRAGKSVTLIDGLCAEAWPHFERGDYNTYLEVIAQYLQTIAADADVIVLAQASMAGAAAVCPDLPIPVLSSPRLGLEAALRSYHTVI